MLKNAVDLNIWDRWSYETSGEVTGGWVINVYTIPQYDAPYGSGKQTEHTLHLRTRDAEWMGLGKETDEDFWVDSQTLFEKENTPRRVRRWLGQVIESLNN